MFTISQATENDIPTIREMAEQTWWPAYADILTPAQTRYMLDAIYGTETIRKEMSSGRQLFLLLADEQGPQAFASYGRRPDSPEVFKLHKLYVLPAAQGKGYGLALIADIKRRLLDEGIHVLDLNVNRFNRARGFYERTGFRVLREEDVPIGPFWMNDYVMRTEF